MLTLRIITLISNLVASAFALLIGAILSLVFLVAAASYGSGEVLLIFLVTFLITVGLIVLVILSAINFAKVCKGKKASFEVISIIHGGLLVIAYVLMFIMVLLGMSLGTADTSEYGMVSAFFMMGLGLLGGIASVVLSIITIGKSRNEAQRLDVEV